MKKEIYTITIDENNGIIAWAKGQDEKTVKEMVELGHEFYEIIEDFDEVDIVGYATEESLLDADEKYGVRWDCEKPCEEER